MYGRNRPTPTVYDGFMWKPDTTTASLDAEAAYWILYYIANIGCGTAIFGGVVTNILAFVVLVRSRLWLKHEGYVYLAANFCVNVGILLFCTSSFWFTSTYGYENYYPPNTSNFMCKVWHFLMSIFFASGWLSVALLFNVNLREHLTLRTGSRRPVFATKYCTLFATKIIVGVIFAFVLVLSVPYLAIYDIYPDDGKCYPSQPKAAEKVLLAGTIVMFAIPFLFFLPQVLSQLCKNRQGIVIGLSEVDKKSVSDDQMRVMAVTLSSTTLFSQCCWIPLQFEAGRRFMATAHVQTEVYFGMSLALQPIFCFVILKGLRDGFRFCCCRRQLPASERDEEVVPLASTQVNPSNPPVSDPNSSI